VKLCLIILRPLVCRELLFGATSHDVDATKYVSHDVILYVYFVYFYKPQMFLPCCFPLEISYNGMKTGVDKIII